MGDKGGKKNKDKQKKQANNAKNTKNEANKKKQEKAHQIKKGRFLNESSLTHGEVFTALFLCEDQAVTFQLPAGQS